MDPQQILRLDPAQGVLSPMVLRHVNTDWPGLFRSQLLHVMPVKELAERLDPIMGAPTRELYRSDEVQGTEACIERAM